MSSRRWTCCSQRLVYLSANHVQGLRLTRALNRGEAGVQVPEDTVLGRQRALTGYRSEPKRAAPRLQGAERQVAETLHTRVTICTRP
jgi:hypothetical protein